MSKAKKNIGITVSGVSLAFMISFATAASASASWEIENPGGHTGAATGGFSRCYTPGGQAYICPR